MVLKGPATPGDVSQQSTLFDITYKVMFTKQASILLFIESKSIGFTASAEQN